MEIYTDGACSGNPGPGGWGVVLRYGRHEKELCGGEATTTTNNRMELTAPICALESLTRRCVVHLYTDSTYVRDGITKWLPRWKSNGWQTTGAQPVKNADLWQQLDAAARSHDVQWHWVKGHAGHPDNERADRLALRGMQEAIDAGNIPDHPSSPTAGAGPDGDECVHELPAGWCSLCKPPTASVLPYGYRTTVGDAYHNDPDCLWLHKGQRRAHRQGKTVHEIQRLAWASVNPNELEPCEFCCTPEWLKRHAHRNG